MAIFKRVLLKLNGESLAGEKGFGIDAARLMQNFFKKRRH